MFSAAINTSRVSAYPLFSQALNLRGMNFPVTQKDTSLFEKMNKTWINVYGLESLKIKNYILLGPILYRVLGKRQKIMGLFLQNDFLHLGKRHTWSFENWSLLKRELRTIKPFSPKLYTIAKSRLVHNLAGGNIYIIRTVCVKYFVFTYSHLLLYLKVLFSLP